MNETRASTGAPTPAASDQPLMFRLMEAAGGLHHRLERAFEEVGLSSAKYGVLAELARAGEPLPLSDLAARNQCVRSNMTQLVDRLEQDGLVRREDDPADRRVVRAALTSLGQERQRAGAERVSRVQADFMAALPEGDREAFERVVEALR